MKNIKAWFTAHPFLKSYLRGILDLLRDFILVFLGCYVGACAVLLTVGYWSL